jgi:hypothetical protein
VIVKLGSWSNNPLVERLCKGLLEIPGTTRQSTPQRCIIRRDNSTFATLGVEKSRPVIEFVPGKSCFAEAHGSRFVKPHPLQQMAREGWLQAKPQDDEEAEMILRWIRSSVETNADE